MAAPVSVWQQCMLSTKDLAAITDCHNCILCMLPTHTHIQCQKRSRCFAVCCVALARGHICMHVLLCGHRSHASPQIDLVQCNISQLQSGSVPLWADVVIMNPPFGTRRKGADLEFLRAAFQVKQKDLSIHTQSFTKLVKLACCETNQ